MSRVPSNVSPESQRPGTFAAALGLLAGCAVTLLGVAGSLSPEIILFRACVASAVAFMVAVVVLAYWKSVTPRREED
ncbi:hypothetical protein [Planctomicrobium piriforme]|uniref:Uncharacterized protein n=1 Tax=Planctomicrobium piriforme TaxID=1576369 RepID=A0A1I3HM57_9PLAN|nr:hypothetical protein [Planctomicrobium piriforme]SFI36804.1 hypothetical protein SAMN05421753_108119 [Planctomicrobium piriforme]